MMKSKTLLLVLLSAIFIFGIGAQSDCGSKKNKNAAANNQPNQMNQTNRNNQSNQNTMSNNSKPAATPAPNAGGEVQTIAEGSYGKMEEPFLFVVRSAETYKQLQAAVEDLPSAAEVDFEKQAIVAAFAGMRRTGGYSVEIKNAGEKIAVSVAGPPEGAMVTEALTMPYKIAVVPIEAENGLNLEVSADWKKAAQTYRLSSGEFEYSGGIAAREKKFVADGTIGVWQFGDLVTLAFDLAGKDANKNMRLRETASGILKGGQINLARLDAGSFSEGPKPPLKVAGTLAADKLTLTFEPLPTNVADGFAARGKLEAVKNR